MSIRFVELADQTTTELPAPLRRGPILAWGAAAVLAAFAGLFGGLAVFLPGLFVGGFLNDFLLIDASFVLGALVGIVGLLFTGFFGVAMALSVARERERCAELAMDALGVKWLGEQIAWQDITNIHADDRFVEISSREKSIRLDLKRLAREEVRRLGDKLRELHDKRTQGDVPASELTNAERKERAALQGLMNRS